MELILIGLILFIVVLIFIWFSTNKKTDFWDVDKKSLQEAKVINIALKRPDVTAEEISCLIGNAILNLRMFSSFPEENLFKHIKNKDKLLFLLEQWAFNTYEKDLELADKFIQSIDPLVEETFEKGISTIVTLTLDISESTNSSYLKEERIEKIKNHLYVKKGLRLNTSIASDDMFVLNISNCKDYV